MAKMRKHLQSTIRYDGSALINHEMDVQDLAPALLALAEIAKIANQKFNGDRASIRVLVNADIEQKCFQLDLSLVQTLLDQAATLIGKENLATAKQIAEIIGLSGPPAGGLFWLFKRIYGQEKKDPEVTFTTNDTKGTTIINIVGDDAHIEVSNQTAILAQDSRVLENVKTVLAPLKNQGYEDFSIHYKDQAIVEINRQEAESIRSTAIPLPSKDDSGNFISTTDAQVEIITAQFKGSAQWGLWWTGRVRPMKIEDTDWLIKFQAGLEPMAKPGAWLDVTMEITQPRDKSQPASFAVKKIKGVLPPDPLQESFI